VGNVANPAHPELEDFGEAALVADTGATGYFRVDWLTPAGLSTWGDGRTIILGTDGYIELRKYTNVATEASGDHLFLVDGQGSVTRRWLGRWAIPFSDSSSATAWSGPSGP
jgi:hypothetical protein